MARADARRRSRTLAAARMPWLMTAVVVALAYQQSAYVPAQVKTGCTPWYQCWPACC
jgi:hypothetical protein